MLVIAAEPQAFPVNTYKYQNNESMIYITVDNQLVDMVRLYSGSLMLGTCVTITNVVIFHKFNKPHTCSKKKSQM